MVLFAAAVAAPPLSFGQEVRTYTLQAADEAKRVLEVKLVAGAVEAKITPGRPYSAETVTETLQVLGDGNRISRTTMTRVYRDGQGRTRREHLGTGTIAQTISISDPVAHTSYVLDPATKTASRTGGTIVMPIGTRPVAASADTRARVEQEHQAGRARGSGGGRGGAVGVVEPSQGLMRTPAPGNPNAKKEELGQQTIEGVSATGTRTTTIIPVGAIGNAQEIRIVSEQWFSPDLQVLVMTRHSDPRSGETTYRLTNIVRAEPDPALFIVPGDYTIRQRGVRQPQ
jgi:hypothetical protein